MYIQKSSIIFPQIDAAVFIILVQCLLEGGIYLRVEFITLGSIEPFEKVAFRKAGGESNLLEWARLRECV